MFNQTLSIHILWFEIFFTMYYFIYLYHASDRTSTYLLSRPRHRTISIPVAILNLKISGQEPHLLKSPNTPKPNPSSSEIPTPKSHGRSISALSKSLIQFLHNHRYVQILGEKTWRVSRTVFKQWKRYNKYIGGCWNNPCLFDPSFLSTAVSEA